jgi:hypothetical protein
MNRRVRTQCPLISDFLGLYEFPVNIYCEGVLVGFQVLGWRS